MTVEFGMLLRRWSLTATINKNIAQSRKVMKILCYAVQSNMKMLFCTAYDDEFSPTNLPGISLAGLCSGHVKSASVNTRPSWEVLASRASPVGFSIRV